MEYENKFIITLIAFMIICFSVSLFSLLFVSSENTNKLIELQNQKEVLEIENLQLKNILEGRREL